MTLLDLDRGTQRQDSDLRSEIESIFNRLTGLQDLEPSSEVNLLLSRLVRLCVTIPDLHSDRVLTDPAIRTLTPRLRQLCGQAEYLLERHWARSIVAANNPHDRLAAFPYLRNYEQLTELELHMLAGLGCDLSGLNRICFIGGGPLPLSALLLGQRLHAVVDVVDRDREATALARDVSGRLGLSERLRTWTIDALDALAVSDCDVVILAALVGAGQEDKRRILAGLGARMRPGSLLVARSAHGLRTLLYPTIDIADLQGFTPLALAHPFTDVVNSVLVARRC